jgi:hypothetical protein
VTSNGLHLPKALGVDDLNIVALKRSTLDPRPVSTFMDILVDALVDALFDAPFDVYINRPTLTRTLS